MCLTYRTLSPAPAWPPPVQVLGKRLGSSMGAVAKAVQGLGAEAILAFEKEGSVTLEGHTLVTGEIKVSAHGVCMKGPWRCAGVLRE